MMYPIWWPQNRRDAWEYVWVGALAVPLAFTSITLGIVALLSLTFSDGWERLWRIWSRGR